MKKPLLHRSEFLSANKVTPDKSPLVNLLQVTSVLNVVFNLTERDINARLLNVEQDKNFDILTSITPFYTEVETTNGALSFAKYLQLFNVLVQAQHFFNTDMEQLSDIISQHLKTEQSN